MTELNDLESALSHSSKISAANCQWGKFAATQPAGARLPMLRRGVLAGAALLAVCAAAYGQSRGPAPSQTGSPAAGARGPAPTLTKPATPNKPPDAAGFIQRWLLLEPIPSVGLTDAIVQAAVTKEYFPGQFTVIPKDGDKVTVGGKELAWHAVDTKLYNVNLYHFAYALNRPTSDVLFWAVTIVNCPQDMPNVRLAIGSNAASVWWVNGNEVIGIYGDRQTVIDDGVSKRLTLKKGPNVVRAAIVNGGGATDFCARFLDADDKPIKGLTVSLVESK
jgi:hypothetical protein